MRSDRANKERYHWTGLVQTDSNWELQLGAGDSADGSSSRGEAWSCAWGGSFGMLGAACTLLPPGSCPGALCRGEVAQGTGQGHCRATAPLPGWVWSPLATARTGGTHWHQDAPLHPLLRARFPWQQMMMSEKSDDSCGRGRRKGSSHTAGSFLLTFGERNNSSASWMGALLGPDSS